MHVETVVDDKQAILSNDGSNHEMKTVQMSCSDGVDIAIEFTVVDAINCSF